MPQPICSPRASPAPPGILTPRFRISIALIAMAPQREAFLEKARTLDQASLFQTNLRPQAREAWQAILKIVPQNAEAAARLGRLAWEDGDHALPRRCSNARRRAKPPHRPGSISGWSARICVTYDQAATAYRKALEKKPDYAEAALNLGTVLQEKRRSRRRHARLRDAYRLRPPCSAPSRWR